MPYCAAARLAPAVFLPRPRLDKMHRFLEDLARGVVTQGLVQALVIVEFEIGGNGRAKTASHI